jgi:hypothetical protein
MERAVGGVAVPVAAGPASVPDAIASYGSTDSRYVIDSEAAFEVARIVKV